MINLATLQAAARLVVAHRAYEAGEINFAAQVLAGTCDHNNSPEVAEVYASLLANPSIVEAALDALLRKARQP